MPAIRFITTAFPHGRATPKFDPCCTTVRSIEGVRHASNHRAISQKTYPMTAAEFDELRGQFAPQSSVRLNVTRHNRKFYLVIERRPPVSIALESRSYPLGGAF